MNEKRTAKLFVDGRSQAVRYRRTFRFDGSEVHIDRDAKTGNAVLSQKPKATWETFLELRKRTKVPGEFMQDRGDEPPQKLAKLCWERLVVFLARRTEFAHDPTYLESPRSSFQAWVARRFTTRLSQKRQWRL